MYMGYTAAFLHRHKYMCIYVYVCVDTRKACLYTNVNESICTEASRDLENYYSFTACRLHVFIVPHSDSAT